MFPGVYFLDQNHDLENNRELTDFLNKIEGSLMLIESPLSEIIINAFKDFNQGIINNNDLIKALNNCGYFPQKNLMVIIDYAFNNKKHLIPIGLTDEEMIEQIKILSNKFDLTKCSLLIGYLHKAVVS